MIRDVTILIPALNEEKTIGKVIGGATERGWIVLVGDNGSTNGTHDISVSKGVTPLSVLRRGKGYAIRELIKHASTPLVVMIDGDGTYFIEDVQRVLKALKDCDVVLGCRRHKEKGSMALLHIIGNYLLSMLASVLYDYRVGDVNTGLKAFRTDKLKEFKLTSGDFTLEADIFVNAIRHKCRMRQVPISYKARPDGSKSKLRMLDGFKIGWFLIKERFRG